MHVSIYYWTVVDSFSVHKNSFGLDISGYFWCAWALLVAKFKVARQLELCNLQPIRTKPNISIFLESTRVCLSHQVQIIFKYYKQCHLTSSTYFCPITENILTGHFCSYYSKTRKAAGTCMCLGPKSLHEHSNSRNFLCGFKEKLCPIQWWLNIGGLLYYPFECRFLTYLCSCWQSVWSYHTQKPWCYSSLWEYLWISHTEFSYSNVHGDKIQW